MTKAPKVTATTTPTADKPVSHTQYYAEAYLNGWQPDHMGPAPAKGLFDVVHALDPKKRPGHEALHIAMALRPQGCTVRQFQIAGNCGPANNYRRSLVTVARVITVDVLPVPGNRAYAYKAKLTAKGRLALVAAGVKVPAALEAKPDGEPKAPRTRASKPRKVKAPALGVDAAAALDRMTNNEPAPQPAPQPEQQA